MPLNGLLGKGYAEGYAGGAGAALNLLFAGYAKTIHLNDADPAIAAMWSAILTQTERFCREIRTIPLSVTEWALQRRIYTEGNATPFELGFAAFYLNRVNRSGIIKNAGPIGGKNQDGKWKIDARFNRETLDERVARVGRYRRKITATCADALDFMSDLPSAVFLYLDPPYFLKGKELYLNHYLPEDHEVVGAHVQEKYEGPWVITYDDVPEIRRVYRSRRIYPFELSYSARTRKQGKEILIASDKLKLPSEWKTRSSTLGNRIAREHAPEV